MPESRSVTVSPGALSFLAVHPGDAAEVAALATLAATAGRIDLPAEGVLLAPGAATSDVAVLEHGVLEVRDGTEVVERLEPGQCFVGRPTAGPGADLASATVVAAEPSSVIVLPQEAVAALRASTPATWGRLQRFLGRQVPSVFLATLEMFRGVDPSLLTVCDESSDLLGLMAGEVLVSPGDPADAIYVVLQGALAVTQDRADPGRDQGYRLLGRGEMTDLAPLLLGESHTATVRAARDTEVIKITRSELEQVLIEAPLLGLRTAALVARELRRVPGRRQVRTVAVAADPGLGRAVTADLLTGLGRTGRSATLASSARVVDQLGADLLAEDPSGRPNPRLLAWLSDLEDRYEAVVFLCDDDATSWTRTALRQADVVLVVADTTRGAGLRPVESDIRTTHPHARVELVLVRPAGQEPRGTAAWLEPRAVGAHHHVRAGVPADLDRLARRLVGADVGVALSGGGARGFAHIGAFKAIAAHGMVVDHVGGTSMGSVIAGEYALGWSIEEMIARNRTEFPAAAVVGDLTLPVLSFGKGRSSVKLLRNLFGEVMIEDLSTPYFCVSCNLSRAEVVVHDRGPLWLWSRASSSVPGVGPPIPFRGELLVDGGVLNNLPADLVRGRCHGPVLAVDVGSQGTLATTAPDLLAEQTGLAALRRGRRARKSGGDSTIMQILTRVTTVSNVDHRRSLGRHADVVVVPDVAQYGPFGWDDIDAIVEAGYRRTTEMLQEWEAAGRPSSGTHGGDLL